MNYRLRLLIPSNGALCPPQHFGCQFRPDHFGIGHLYGGEMTAGGSDQESPLDYRSTRSNCERPKS
jgi:hypothetical protein